MIKDIIFDIGNVLTDFRWEDFLRDKGLDGAMIERIADASVKSQVWNEVDRGVWTEEELLAAFVENDPEIEDEIRFVYSNLHGLVTLRDYAVPWVQELKQNGYRIWYLSNFSERAEKECADALSFIPYMDGGILSYREMLIKPDPAIYRRLLERYHLTAGECVFVDDTSANVEAAIAQGIHGIVFHSREQVLEEMRALGIST